MRKRWLANLALAVLVAALASIALLEPGKKKDSGNKPLTTLAAGQVVDISISRPDQEEVVLKRDGDRWRMIRPRVARADRYRVDRLLQLLSAGSEGTLPAQDLGKFGLATPLAIVRFNEAELRFGSLHPFNNLQYVLHQGEVHLLSAAQFAGTAHNWTDFLSTALLEMSVKPVKLAFPAFSLAADEGNWKLAPERPGVSGDRINGFVEEWRFARAFSVTPHEGKPPGTKIRIEYIDEADKAAGTKTIEIGIVATQPEVVLHRADEGLDYHFPVSTGERLLDIKPE